MRGRTRALLMISVPIVALMGLPALAFHDGGVAHCNGCHTMHNSQDGVPVDPDSPNGNAFLLVDSTPSDVCLGCHADGLGAVLGDDPLAPPPEKGSGNFVFLTEDNINDGHGGATDPISGDAAGHNLDAPGYGIGTDATLSAAPGGTFPAGQMGCTSCHDPHGNAFVRLLNTTGPVQDGIATFVNPAPDAAGISIFFGAEAPGNHTAYLSGMSAWCANCHGDFHNNNTVLIHPSGSAIGGSIANTYNLYNGTDDQTGGTQPTAYLPEVPFEDPSATTASTAGPSASSQVSCITCHRAHATSARDAGRWDFDVTFLHEDGDESGSYEIPDPYASLNQRSLCNKCHRQDENNAPFVP